MTDPFDRLRQPVEPLAPPRGTFDEVLARARRRRTARAAAVMALATVIIAGAGGLAFTAGRPVGGGRLEGPAGGGTPAPTVRSTPPATPPAPSGAPATAGPPAPLPASLPHGPVPPGFLPYSVTSVGAGVSYLLGDAPCRVAPCTSVLRSTDGGRSWVGLPAPKAPLPPWQDGRQSAASTVRDIRFASVRDGWAYGGALYATHDAGGHWTPVDAGGKVLDLATDGTTTYAVVASCPPRGVVCINARLRSTPASGDRWQDVPGARVAGGNFGQLSLSGGTGIVMLSQSSGASAVFVRFESRWRPAPSPCVNELSAVTASASSQRLFGFCGGGAAGSLYLLTSTSDDGGRTWHRQPGSALGLADGTGLSVAAATAAVSFATMLSPDFPNNVAVSRDGGQTWVDAALPQLPGGWRYVGARTATSVVALPAKPDGSVWTSRDAGSSWTAYRFR